MLALLLMLAGCATPGPAPGVLTRGDAADPQRDLLVTVLPGPMPPAALFRALAAEYGMELRAEWPIAPLGVVCAVFRVADAAAVAALLARLAADPRIEQAQALNLFQTVQAPEPGAPDLPADPLLGLQHAARGLNLAAAHRHATGLGVRVAVIDSGIAAAHEDLAGAVEVLRDFVAAPPAEVPAERHGTAMAGVIGARAENRRGILGVAPAATLLGLRACWEAPPAASGRCSSFTLARAVSFAIGARADVINLSLAGPRDPLLARLIVAARAAGIVVVAARGEGGVDFPAAEPGVIAVAATRPAAGDVAAPGERVLTTVPEGYDFVSGGSVAAAHVSGLAALIRERTPGADAAAVLAALRLAAAPGGVPDACRALGPACAPGRGPPRYPRT
jgi:hypothetical protein